MRSVHLHTHQRPNCRNIGCFLLALIFLFSFEATFALAAEKKGTFETGQALLTKKDFDQKATGIQMLAESGHEQALKILEHMQAGTLFYIKKNKKLVYAKKDGRRYVATAVDSGEALGTFKKRQLKKITINNQLRAQLKDAIASMNLKHPDPSARLAAVNQMLDNVTPQSAAILAPLLQSERDKKVKEALETALALANLTSSDSGTRLAALATLKGNLHPAVRNRLNEFIKTEKEAAVIAQAKASLASIESRIAWCGFIETIFFGLSLGSVLVLAAIGLAITFGVIGVINMAHGELIMLGAYTTYVMQQMLPNAIGTALLLSVPAAFLVSGLAGIAIEKSVIRFLYGRPLETLLATFGISLILQQAVRTVFSPLNRSVATPAWMSGSIQINAVLSLTTNRVAILVFAMLVFAGLFVLLKKSTIGLQVRAISQNRAMSMAMGVPAARVDALTFGLGSGIAGVAGVALSQLTNVGPNLGQAYIIDSFLVVVFGGVGNLWGTLLGGLSLGVANKFSEPWAGAVMAKIMLLVIVILFIQKRPQGLFPQKGRAAG